MLRTCYTKHAGVPLSSCLSSSPLSLHVRWICLPCAVLQRGAASAEFACCKFVQGHAQRRPGGGCFCNTCCKQLGYPEIQTALSDSQRRTAALGTAPGLADGLSGSRQADGAAASFLTAFPLAFGKAGQVSHPPFNIFWPPCSYLLLGGALAQGEGQGAHLTGVPHEMLPVNRWKPPHCQCSPSTPSGRFRGWDLSGAGFQVQLPEVLYPPSFNPLLAQGLRAHSMRWWWYHRCFAAWPGQ